MNAETRTSTNYLDGLYQYHTQQGNPIEETPLINNISLNLYRLKSVVESFGGYFKVFT